MAQYDDRALRPSHLPLYFSDPAKTVDLIDLAHFNRSIVYRDLYQLLARDQSTRSENGIRYLPHFRKDAKDALKIGEVGIITYNDEFVATWTSDFFAQRDISLVNKK